MSRIEFSKLTENAEKGYWHHKTADGFEVFIMVDGQPSDRLTKETIDGRMYLSVSNDPYESNTVRIFFIEDFNVVRSEVTGATLAYLRRNAFEVQFQDTEGDYHYPSDEGTTSLVADYNARLNRRIRTIDIDVGGDETVLFDRIDLRSYKTRHATRGG